MQASISEKLKSIILSLFHSSAGPIEKLPKWKKAAQIAVLSIQQIRKDLCFERAASLAFTTTLSTLPLVILCFAVLGHTEFFKDLIEDFRNFIVGYVGESSQDEVLAQFDRLKVSISEQAKGVGSVALGALAFAVLSLFRSAESTFSKIWNAHVKRGFFQKLGNFWLMLTATPLILGASIVVKSILVESLTDSGGTAKVDEAVDSWGFLHSFTEQLVLNWMFPISISFFAFSILYVYLPNTKVKINHAAGGALIAALCWQGLTQGFRTYVEGAFLSGVYGALGVVPFFLFWIYLSWFIALMGAEVSYTLQNYRILVEEVRYKRREGIVTEPVLALLFMERIYRAFKGEAPEVCPDTLAHEFQVPLSRVEILLGVLLDQGFIVEGKEGTLTPIYAANRLSALSVVESFPSGVGYQTPRSEIESQIGTLSAKQDSEAVGIEAKPGDMTADLPVRNLLREIQEHTKGRLDDLNFDHLSS